MEHSEDIMNNDLTLVSGELYGMTKWLNTTVTNCIIYERRIDKTKLILNLSCIHSLNCPGLNCIEIGVSVVAQQHYYVPIGFRLIPAQV